MLVHVVPHLPPHVSGVGDFATQLGAQVGRVSTGQIISRYVAAGWDATKTPAPAPASDLTGRRDSDALVRTLSETSPAAVLVHFVGYGYEKRGHPVWLVQALRTFRRDRPEVRVLTWFHELYAFGPPWRSSFWTSPVQRWTAAEVARLSDAAFTNRYASADWLRRHAPHTPVEIFPTYSSVGEPEQVWPWADREPAAVVFGGAGQREAVYARPSDRLARALERAGIERIWDIGPAAAVPDQFAGRPVEKLGRLPIDVLGERLQATRVGLVDYAPAYLTKSSIVAAYLAHAVPVVTVSNDRRPTGPGAPPYVAENEAETADLALSGVAGHEWYREHAHSAKAGDSVARAAHLTPKTTLSA